MRRFTIRLALLLLAVVNAHAQEAAYPSRPVRMVIHIGAGSSMELIHPALDGSLPSAWRDSDESTRSEWQTYSCSGTNLQLRTEGAPTDFKELHFHLVGDSHIALRNIQVWLNGEGTNLLVNADRLILLIRKTLGAAK